MDNHVLRWLLFSLITLSVVVVLWAFVLFKVG